MRLSYGHWVPVQILRQPGEDVVFGEIGEVGVVPPSQYLRPGDTRVLTNPFAPQVPQFQVRVWPACDEKHAENIDLIARAHRGRPNRKDEKVEDAVDTQTILRMAEKSQKVMLHLAEEHLVLGASNRSARALVSMKSGSRLLYRPWLDLTAHRGIGVTVEGDGSKSLLCISFGKPRPRDYVVPIDFTGERTFQIPCGEASWVHPQWG